MDSIWLKEAMKLEKFRFDEKRQQVRARFHELKKPGKRDAPQYVLCSFEFYDFRKDGKRRSEKEQTNLLTRLYAEKLSDVRKKRRTKNRTRAARKTRVRKLQEAWNEDQRSDAVMDRSGN